MSPPQTGTSHFPDHIRRGSEVVVDVAIVGSGIAGLVTALDLLDARPDVTVVLIDKGAVGESGSTPLAQGGLAAAVGHDDSPNLHAADTERAGDGHCNPRSVAVMAAETPDRVADLRARGAVFDTESDGDLALAREGGQTVGRSVRAADATGAEIFRSLRTAAVEVAEREGRLIRLQGMAASLATGSAPDAPVTGVWMLLDDIDGGHATPAQDPGLILVRAKAVMLATGGCGGLYAATTNRDGATGDALAMAGRVGAALHDIEFVQFHPTGLKAPGKTSFQRFLLTEALRGAGAHLLDAEGNRFMPSRHPDAELAPRHVVAKAILDQPGGAWLDARMIEPHQMKEEFPTVLDGAQRFGFDLLAEPVPVEPCEHYMIGGVATDLWGRTSVPGLYAAGEVASSGVHGANRMAGNSLAQSCVFAHRAATDMARSLPEEHAAGDPDQPTFASADRRPYLRWVRSDLRKSMSAGAGAIRDAAGLAATRQTLQNISKTVTSAWGGPRPPLQRDALEVANMLVAANAIVEAAARRQESRGSHFRTDYPDPDPGWAGRRQRVRLTGSMP
ncbi:L-aspartate oxidase [Euzebya tangerina]|uniref:L-aspartate oxidase n=1 Tax=Euzebya tangerina TaxID=591198 RepID=UPI000E314D3C|nr:FAD-dependent oxidoreductase [Euzebya tangerina]